MSGGKKVNAEKEERGEKAEKKIRVLQRRREAGIVVGETAESLCARIFFCAYGIVVGGACRLYNRLTF